MNLVKFVILLALMLATTGCNYTASRSAANGDTSSDAITLASGQSLTGVPMQFSEIGFDLAPHSDDIIFTARGQGGSGLYRLTGVTGRVSTILDTKDYETSPCFAPDGRSIAYAAGSSGMSPLRIYTYALNGSSPRQITQTSKPEEQSPVYDRDPTFSPDGSYLAFARARRNRDYSMGGTTWDNWDIWVVKTNGSGLRRLTSGNYYSMSGPSFSRDGKFVTFAATTGSQPATAYQDSQGIPTSIPYNVLLVNVNGDSEPHLLTRDDHSSNPAFGNLAGRETIVFTSDRVTRFDYQLWLMDRKGKAQRQLRLDPMYGAMPRLTANGKHIVFIHSPAQQMSYSLWQVASDGSHAHQIADGKIFDNPLHSSTRPFHF